MNSTLPLLVQVRPFMEAERIVIGMLFNPLRRLMDSKRFICIRSTCIKKEMLARRQLPT